MNEDTLVTITKEEYESLLDDSFKLNCLETYGVDAWGGYDTAMSLYNSGEDDE